MWDAGDYSRAAAAYDAIDEKNPRSSLAPEALYLAASLHAFYLNAPAAGAERFTRLLSRYPNYPKADQARLHLGALYLGPLEKPEAAILIYRELTEHGASDAARQEGQFRLGLAYASAGNPESARREWIYLLERYHQGSWSERAKYEIASSLDRQQKTIEALNAYQEFVSDYPAGTYKRDAQIAIADCLERLDRPQEAVALLETIRDDSGNVDIVRIRLERLNKRIHVLKLIKR